MSGLFGGSAGGGGGGSSNAGAGQLALLANQPQDPYATPTMDQPAFDPQSLFTNPVDVAPAAFGGGDFGLGGGDSGSGTSGPQPGFADVGGSQSTPNQQAEARGEQGGGTASAQTDETQSILSRLAQNINPIGTAQAKDAQVNPWVTGGPSQGQNATRGITYASPEQREQFYQQNPNLDRPHPGTAIPGTAGQGITEAGAPEPDPGTTGPVGGPSAIQQMTSLGSRPLNPQAPPPVPEPQPAAIPLPRPRPEKAGAAAPAASAAPPGGGQQGFDPLKMIEQIFGLPGQIISSLLGISTQATPNYRYNAQRGGQTLSNLGNILAGHPELVRHGAPQSQYRGSPFHSWEGTHILQPQQPQQPQQRTPSGQPAPERNTPPQHQEDGAPRPDAKAAAAGQSSDVPAHVLAGARQAAMQGGPGAVFRWMAQNGHAKAGPWCGEFAAAVMQSQGLPIPDHPETASNWRNWGTPTRTPQAGDIAIRQIGYPGSAYAGRYVPTGEAGAHVTTVERVYPDGSMDIIGGNQSRMREHVSQQGYDFRTMSTADASAPRPPGRIPTPQPQRVAMAPSIHRHPPMHGARRGRDGRWYVHRGGRYYRVAEDQPQNAQA